MTQLPTSPIVLYSVTQSLPERPTRPKPTRTDAQYHIQLHPSSSILFINDTLLLSLDLHLGGSIHLSSLRKPSNDLLDSIHRRSRTTGLSQENLTLLGDRKDAALGALWGLLQSDGADERGCGIAEERVGQVLLGTEGGVCLWRVGREAVDGETACC